MEFIDTKRKDVVVIGNPYKCKFLKYAIGKNGEVNYIPFGEVASVAVPKYLEIVIEKFLDDEILELHLLFMDPYKQIIDRITNLLSNNTSNFRLVNFKLDVVETINQKTNKKITTNRCLLKKVDILQ